MTEKEILNRINISKQQLQLFEKYRDFFERFFGKKRLQKEIDETLDEIILRTKQLRELKNKNDE